MKSRLSSFDLYALAKEAKILEGGFLQKVYQPLRHIIVMRFNTDHGRRHLVHSVGSWLYITDKFDYNMGTPGDFAMTMRKETSNAFVTMVQQHEFDRILEVDLNKEMPYRLVFEMFGEGNLVLVKAGKILAPFRSEVWKHRILRRDRTYKFPPERFNPLSARVHDLEGVLRKSTRELVRSIATEINLGGQYAEEICMRASIDKFTPVNELGTNDIERIYEILKGIIREAEAPVGYIYMDGDEKVDFSPVKLVTNEGLDILEMKSMSEAVAAYFPLEAEVVDESEEAFRTRMEALRRQKEQQLAGIEGFEREAGECKMKAEALYENFQGVERFLEIAKRIREEEGWEALLAEFPDARLNRAEASAVLSLPTSAGEKVSVRIDIRKDVNQNASHYYEKSKVMKDKLDGAREALMATERMLKAPQKIQEPSRQVLKKRQIGRRYWFETYRWFISTSGNIVIAGRDAKTNDRVVRKYLKAGDRYAHADVHGAPSVVIKAQDVHGNPMEIGETTLEEACYFATCFSRVWSANVGSASAYWVLPEQVSRTPQSGEYLPKGAFIIRGKRNILRNIPLELRVGAIEIEEVQKIMCAPSKAIESRAARSVKIVPGRERKSDVARKLAELFQVHVDEVLGILPSGGSEILEE
jgi:predicted ribosome quality control (RQC) complex YloA/Tae2 family protein